MGPSTKRRKLNTSAVEEIKFDDNARADYLTGFHKRKLARIKEAQAQAAKKEKAERLVMREEVSLPSIISSHS
jgi:ribosomal RNA-processing protein 17